MIRVLIPLVLFIIIVVFLGIGLQNDPRKVPSPLIGKPVPEFVLPRLQEAEQQISNHDLKGQVALLNVWASWCTPCLQEHPLLMKIAKQQVVPIFGLNYKDTRDNALKVLSRHGNPFVMTAFDVKGDVSIDFGVYGAPETFIIGTDGNIAYKHVGIITPQIWDETMLPLINELKNTKTSDV